MKQVPKISIPAVTPQQQDCNRCGCNAGPAFSGAQKVTHRTSFRVHCPLEISLYSQLVWCSETECYGKKLENR